MRRVIVICTACALCAASAAFAATARTVSAVEQGDTFAYSDSKLRAKPGKVTLKMRNPSSLHLEHSISIRGNGVSKKGRVVQPGGTSTVSARLKKGRYTFYCHVKGHEENGMKGRLVVR